jgi:ubiquinol-cytochrome c reductase iron-sulfur subunit
MSTPSTASRPRATVSFVAAVVSFVVALIAAVVLIVIYLQGGQPQLEGLFLALTCGGIGIGIVLWAKHEIGEEEVEEERPDMASSEEEVEAFKADFAAGEEQLTRRKVLLVLLGGAVAALGAALLLPIRSLGPRPGRGLKETAFRDGVRLVNEQGEPVFSDDIPVDGVITVWPEGDAQAPDSPTLLIRTRADQEMQPLPGREDWTPENLVAYSKLCTHTGCPVGLYQAEEGLLLCPCHQSTFDVLAGATPIFGPAARPLPQLPLAVDENGSIIATGDFSDPVGPGFWDRGR